jgi:hypothetical protein
LSFADTADRGFQAGLEQPFGVFELPIVNEGDRLAAVAFREKIGRDSGLTIASPHKPKNVSQLSVG